MFVLVPVVVPCATVVTLTGGGVAFLFKALAGLALVAFRAGAVEILVHAVARGSVLAWVWITSVRGQPAGDLWEQDA